MSAISNNKNSIGLAVKQLTKELIWYSCNHHRAGNDPDFAIFGSRRSGSTLLMQIIACNCGIKYVDQPFSIYSASSNQIRYLPIFESGQYVELDNEETKQITEFILSIRNGQLHINEPWRVWDKTFHFISNRLVFKVTDAHHIAEKLEKLFSWESIFLSRHPIPQSLGVMRNGWGCRAKGFLLRESFVQKYLPGSLEAYAWDIYRGRDVLQRHVLGWCLENIGLIQNALDRGRRSYIAYEHLLYQRSEIVKKLSDSFGLHQSSMDKQCSKTSYSTKGYSIDETKKAIKSGNSMELLRSWRKIIDSDTENACLNILDRLGIGLYVPGKDVPTLSAKIIRRRL